MNKLTIEEALKLDSKSDRFFEVYRAISDKYWTFEDPSDYQQYAKLLVNWAERFDPDKVILASKVIVEVSKMVQKKQAACSMHLAFSDIEYYVDIASSEVDKDKLQSLVSKAHKAIDNGNITVKGQ